MVLAAGFPWLWPIDPETARSANRSYVSNAPQSEGCVSLPQNLLATPTLLAYQADVSTPTTKESHMANQLCAFTRGTVLVGTWGMHRA